MPPDYAYLEIGCHLNPRLCGPTEERGALSIVVNWPGHGSDDANLRLASASREALRLR